MTMSRQKATELIIEAEFRTLPISDVEFLSRKVKEGLSWKGAVQALADLKKQPIAGSKQKSALLAAFERFGMLETLTERDLEKAVTRAQVTQSEFSLAPVEMRLSPIFAEQDALKAAKAAFEILKSGFPDIINSLGSGRRKRAKPTSIAERWLLETVHVYWVERRVYNQKPPAEFNDELDKISNDIGNLQYTLSAAPEYVRGELDVRLRCRRFQPPDQFCSEPQIDKFEAGLKEIAILCQELKQPTQRGAQKKSHVTNAVVDLVNLWGGAGRDFKWRFDRAKGTAGAPEFVSEGAQFVWTLMSIIDPDLDIGEVARALKQLAPPRRTMSTNSRSAQRI